MRRLDHLGKTELALLRLFRSALDPITFLKKIIGVSTSADAMVFVGSRNRSCMSQNSTLSRRCYFEQFF